MMIQNSGNFVVKSRENVHPQRLVEGFSDVAIVRLERE